MLAFSQGVCCINLSFGLLRFRVLQTVIMFVLGVRTLNVERFVVVIFHLTLLLEVSVGCFSPKAFCV